MKRYLYKKNLPSFERYELFDTREEDWEATVVIPEFKNRGIRDIETLYIKGVKRVDNYKNKIEYKEFFNDYLKLGRNLFELSMTEHKVHFVENYELDIITLTSNYIEKNFFEIPLSDSQERIIKNIIDLKEDFLYMDLPDYFNNLIFDIINLIDDIMDLLNLLLREKNYSIDDYLNELWGIIEEAVDVCDILSKKDEFNEISKLFSNCQTELNKLFKKIEQAIKNSKIDLRKKIIISNAQKSEITKSNILNKYEESPLIVIFTYDQLNDLKNIITNFLKKYGFPYYVFTEDEKDYKNYVNDNIIKINSNDDVIPCNILILNSIFNYLLYTILTEWKTADSKIKKIWGFDEKKLKSKNITTIHKIRKMYSYFNSNLSSKLYNFKNHINNIDDEHNFNMEFLNDENDYKNCDNYFKSDKDEEYCEFYFNNLCIAANEILNRECKYDDIDAESKNCPNCGEVFIPSKSYRVYCCDKCRKEGRKNKKNENKRNERKKNKVL